MTDASLLVWGRILTGGHELPPSRIEIQDGRITGVEPGQRPRGADFAVDDGWILPGLIDLQVNGVAGADLTSAEDPEAALVAVAGALAQRGVTAFCPTIVSSREEVIVERLPVYRARTIEGGAESLGIHVEGPFINRDFRGVHEPELLRLATPAEIDRWLRVGQPAIVTLAPERPGGLAAIKQLAKAGVLVSLGHSGATSHEAQLGLAAGARLATHLFNAMPPLHHRQTGLVGAVLASDAVVELIADSVHLDPLIVDLVVQRAGVARVALVSDALAAAGLPPGESLLGHQIVVSDGRIIRRADGTLAGSALLLDGCLRNALRWLPKLQPAEVVLMATQTPANALQLPRKGRVAVGADADLVIMDADWRVRHTIVGGKLVTGQAVGANV
jgi:N-acetylglucosamine-6-phosphate deacetylase